MRHTSKATVSNFGPVITAAELYKRTGDAVYLAFAEKTFAFWWANMVNGTTGQVADHMNAPAGDVVWWSFTYNQACATLYRCWGRRVVVIHVQLGMCYIVPLLETSCGGNSHTISHVLHCAAAGEAV